MAQPRAGVQPPTHIGESITRVVRSALQWWAPVTQSVLSVLLAAVLVWGVDRTLYASGQRDSYWNIFTDSSLRPSDITTLVSASLVAIRLATQSLVALVAWQCVRILLQNDGLNLSQLDTMITYRLPRAWSGRHACLIGLVLLMMIPSGFIAPVLSGAIDWKPAVNYEETKSVRAGFGPLDRGTERIWINLMNKTHERLVMLNSALGRASVSWIDETTDRNWTSLGRYRYVARDRAPKLNSEVKDVPIPIIEVHSISWSDPLEDWVWPFIRYQSRVIYTPGGDRRDQTYTIGNAILFQQNMTFPTSPRNAEVFSTTRKIAVLVGKHGVYLNGAPSEDVTNMTDARCELEPLRSAKRWEGISNWTLVPGIWGNCWAVGNINFSTGIRYFDTGRYIMDRTIEANSTGKDAENLVGDTWSEYTTFMLSDIMSTLPSAKLNLRANGNLTQYTEELIHQSYTAMRTALFPFTPEPSDLKTQRPVAYVQAKVDRIRVVVWLVLNLLLPVSVLIVSLIERPCMRNTLAETTLGLLLTDVRQVVHEEGKLERLRIDVEDLWSYFKN